MSVDPNLQAIFSKVPAGKKPLTEAEMKERVLRLLHLLRDKGPDATSVDEP